MCSIESLKGEALSTSPVKCEKSRIFMFCCGIEKGHRITKTELVQLEMP